MLKDLVTNVKYLNNLFTENDFNFINSLDNQINDINSKISYQENIRTKIIQFISSVTDLLKLEDPEIDNLPLYKLSNDVISILESINDNINILTELSKKINELDTEIINLLLEIDEENYEEEYYSYIVNNIKLKIDEYSVIIEESNRKLIKNEETINLFLSDSNTKHYLDGFNINLSSSYYNGFDDSISQPLNYKVNEMDNNILIISEKDNKVFLPYKIDEINALIEKFPEQYSSFENVIAKEYILPLEYFMTHTVLARFREAYSLCNIREGKSVFESLRYGIDMMFNRRLNPAIIAACKTQQQLSNYIDCLKNNNLNDFKDFEIRFEMSPL